MGGHLFWPQIEHIGAANNNKWQLIWACKISLSLCSFVRSFVCYFGRLLVAGENAKCRSAQFPLRFQQTSPSSASAFSGAFGRPSSALHNGRTCLRAGTLKVRPLSPPAELLVLRSCPAGGSGSHRQGRDRSDDSKCCPRGEEQTAGSRDGT